MQEPQAVPPFEEVSRLPEGRQRAIVARLAREHSDQELAGLWGMSLPQVRQYRRGLGIRKGSRGQLLSVVGGIAQPAPEPAPARSEAGITAVAPGRIRHEEAFHYTAEGTGPAEEFTQRIEDLRALLDRFRDAEIEYTLHLVSRRPGEPTGEGAETKGEEAAPLH